MHVWYASKLYIAIQACTPGSLCVGVGVVVRLAAVCPGGCHAVAAVLVLAVGVVASCWGIVTPAQLFLLFGGLVVPVSLLQVWCLRRSAG